MRKFFTLLLLFAVGLAGRLSAQTYEVVKTITINHDELEKAAYSATWEPVDIASVCEALGIDNISQASYKCAIPDGNGGYTYENVTTDGWRNPADATQLAWGNAGVICTKVWETNGQAMGNITYIGCLDTSHLAGESYTFPWAFVHDDKAVILNVVITFVAQATYKPTILKTITVNHEELEKVSYSGTTDTFDLSEVLTALGAGSAGECKTYIVNCTNGNFVANTTDGWRNADGDAADWASATNGVCVKLDNLASGVFSYIGCHDANFSAGDVYHAKWGVVNSNDEAVVLDVVITFVVPATYKPTIVKTIDVSYETLEKVAGTFTEDLPLGDETMAAIKETLGVEDLSTCTTWIVNTDDNFVENTTDGWRDSKGNASGWSTDAAGICVKLDLPGARYNYIGAFDNSHLAGEVYHARWGVVNGNDEAVVLDLAITFVAAPIATLADLTAGEKGRQAISVGQGLLNTGTVTHVAIDVEAVAEALGCAVADLKLYAEKADGITDAPTALNQGYWLDANGKATSWGENAAIYFEPDNNADYSAIHIGQYSGAFNEAATWTGKLYFVNETALSYYTLDVTVTVNPAEALYADAQTTLPEVIGRKACVTLTGRTFNAGWNTLVLPFAVTRDLMAAVLGDGDAQLAIMQDATAEAVLFTSVDEVAANTPCLLYVGQEATGEFVFDEVDVTEVVAAPTAEGTALNFVGTYVQTAVAENSYILGAGSTFEKVTDESILPAFRACLTPKNSADTLADTLYITLDGTTAIHRIDGTNVRNGASYSLAGQPVRQPRQKGVYVKDGRKVVVR